MNFPNFKNKHAEDSMFTPDEFMNYRRERGKYPEFSPPDGVIFCYQNELLSYVLDNYETTKVDSFYGVMYLINETDNRVAIVGKFGIGAPVVTVLLEELIAFGVGKFISVGTAGTLQKNIGTGSLMVCEKAIRDEGTSHHYAKHTKYAYASEELTEKIKKSLDNIGEDYFVGTSWTIDTPYRETISEAKQYQKEGVSTVEMEASALFTVGEYRGVDVGSVFTISDSLAELEWNPEFHLKETEEGLKTLYNVAVEVLLDNG